MINLNTVSPELMAYVTEDDQRVDENVYGQKVDELTKRIERGTTEYKLAGRAFRLFEERPFEWDESQALICLGEFGNGLNHAAVARAIAIRDAVMPNANLLMFPNDCYEDRAFVNLSKDERRRLRHGDPGPMVERVQTTLEKPPELQAYETVAVFGPSQGGTIGAAVAADPNSPVVALHTNEAPNVKDRSRLKLVRNFAGSGAHLKDAIRINGDPELLPIVGHHIDQLTIPGMARFVRGIVLPQNIALAAILRRNSLEDDFEKALYRGGSVVHYWTDKDEVSPADENWEIAHRLSAQPRYDGRQLDGLEADHSSTNVAYIGIAGTRKAYDLLRQTA